MQELLDYFERTLRRIIREEIGSIFESQKTPEVQIEKVPAKLMTSKEAAEFPGNIQSDFVPLSASV